jgi:hypothetical protein
MSDVLTSANQVLIFVKEGTYGTDAVDAAFTANDDISYLIANAEAELTPLGDSFTPDRARASQSGVKSNFIQRGCEVSVPVPLVGGDSADNYALPYGPILESAGFTVSNDGSATTYTLSTAEAASGTLYQYRRRAHSDNWRLKRGRGVRTNINIQGTVGEEAIMTAVGQGIGYHDYTVARAYFDSDGEPALDSDGSSLTYTGTAAPMSDERLICKAATATYNSGDLPLVSFDVDFAMGIVPIEEMTSDPTHAAIVRIRDGVSPANGNLTFTTRDSGAALEDIQAALTANEEANLVITLAGPTTEIVITLRIQYTGRAAESANAGAMNFTVPFQVRGDFSSHPFGDNGATIVAQAAS